MSIFSRIRRLFHQGKRRRDYNRKVIFSVRLRPEIVISYKAFCEKHNIRLGEYTEFLFLHGMTLAAKKKALKRFRES